MVCLDRIIYGILFYIMNVVYVYEFIKKFDFKYRVYVSVFINNLCIKKCIVYESKN